jgi:lipoprotein-anchoring transpeptidase ErfK/SrfK
MIRTYTFRLTQKSVGLLACLLVVLIVSAAPISRAATKVRPAGTPLKGWAVVGKNEWPAVGDALTVSPVKAAVVVRSKPDSASPGVTLQAGQAVVGKVVLLVVGHNENWWKVLVPARPNGTVGWVRHEDVVTQSITDRIVIELSTNTLTYWSKGAVVLTEQVATGTGDTPTPAGLFAIKERVKQSDPDGFLGPVALGLTGFSEVLYKYSGGQGTVAIHGTSAPKKLGLNVSHGCIRVRNEAILRISKSAPLGTPVEIVNRLSELPTGRWTPPIVPE